jgi:GNAT superfamily N-acetyltransferase
VNATPPVRTASPADVPVLGEALADAFYDDPVFGWLMPVDRRRHRGLRRFFAIELRAVGLARGSVWTTDALEGAALSTPPGMWRLPWAVSLRHEPGFARAFGPRLPHATALLQLMERRHIREPHHYFPYIGVAPASQGQGLGTALMRPTLDLCDEARLPAYLEATSERNVALYERLGFATVDELTLGGSPPLVLMRRDAAR